MDMIDSEQKYISNLLTDILNKAIVFINPNHFDLLRLRKLLSQVSHEI